MSFLHFTRSKARRPNVSDSDEGDIEPDDVAPGAATHPVLETPSFHTPVRSRDEAARGPESQSTESAGPVPVPAAPSPDEAPPSGDGPGLSGSAGPPLAGVPLGCPGSRAGPTTADSPVRGPMSSQTGMELPQYQRPRASSLRQRRARPRRHFSRRRRRRRQSRCSRRHVRTLLERRLQLETLQYSSVVTYQQYRDGVGPSPKGGGRNGSAPSKFATELSI